MKRSIKVILVLPVAAILTGCVFPLPSSLWCDGSKAGPPTVEQVANTWVGYTNDELMFFRLELNTNGSGRCAFVHLPDTCLYEYGVKKYSIRKWGLDSGRIEFELQPTSTKDWPIYLKGMASGHMMHLEVGAPDGSWSRKLVMRPEGNFLVPNRDTKEAMDGIAQPEVTPYR